MLKYIPILSLLVYTPIVCYLDYKYREVKHTTWIPLLLINIPVYIILFILGDYQWWMIIISLVSIIIYFISMKLHYIEGADFVYLTWISLFFIYNPFTSHWNVSLSYNIFLISMLIVTGFIVVYWNVLNKKGLSFEFDRGIPMMFPISFALILTTVIA